MARLGKAWPIAASVAMVLASFPPFDLGLLAFVALVPWMLSLKSATGWGAFRSGYLFGVLFWFGQMSWLQPLVQRWTGSLALSLVPYVLAPFIGALYFAAAAWLIRACWLTRTPLLIPLAWAGIEVIRSWMPLLAFPWGLMASPLTPYPAMIQLAHYGTIYLVSAWVVLANVAFAMALDASQRYPIRVVGLVWFALLGVSMVRYASAPDGTPTVVTAGQLGTDLAFGDPDTRDARVRAAVDVLARAAQVQGSRLLILPEGVAHRAVAMPPPIPFALPESVPILFGGQRGDYDVYQTAFAYDGEWGAVDKRRLVVFGEYVPFRDALPFLESFELPGGDLTPAERTTAIEVGGILVGPLLCFEALFFDVGFDQARNGSQILAAMVIDDWYMGTIAPAQLRMAGVWRAVETGLPLVRVGPLGYTEAVDARGNVVARARLGETVALRCEVALPEGTRYFPPIVAFPWLFGLSCLAPVALLWLEIGRRSGPKRAGS